MAETTAARQAFPRREMPRHSSSVQVTCYANGSSFVGTIVNISITGAMIMGCQPIAPNTKIRVNLPDVGEVSAMIVWNNGEALGLSFEVNGDNSQSVEERLSKTVNHLPEQEDRRAVSQYTQPTMHH